MGKEDLFHTNGTRKTLDADNPNHINTRIFDVNKVSCDHCGEDSQEKGGVIFNKKKAYCPSCAIQLYRNASKEDKALFQGFSPERSFHENVIAYRDIYYPNEPLIEIRAKQATHANLKIKCVHCHDTFELLVKEEDYQKYKNGTYVQEAFPYLTAAQRELILSQICGDCWDKIFGGEDEDSN